MSSTASNHYNFACKHDGTLFFKDHNGGNVTDATNKLRKHYRPPATALRGSEEEQSCPIQPDHTGPVQ